MTTANKLRKTNTAKTANSQKTRVKALDKCISYNEKLRLMVLEVLREESGRELANEARFNDTEFDWEAHNTQFRADYSETSLKELMRAARTLYGLIDKHFHKGQDVPGCVRPNVVVPNRSCDATVDDVDGNTYDVVAIGDQCWMQENLKVPRTNSGITASKDHPRGVHRKASALAAVHVRLKRGQKVCGERLMLSSRRHRARRGCEHVAQDVTLR